jgi:hypothetical protein
MNQGTQNPFFNISKIKSKLANIGSANQYEPKKNANR